MARWPPYAVLSLEYIHPIQQTLTKGQLKVSGSRVLSTKSHLEGTSQALLFGFTLPPRGGGAQEGQLLWRQCRLRQCGKHGLPVCLVLLCHGYLAGLASL